MSSTIEFGNLAYLLLLWAIPLGYLLFWIGRSLRSKAAQRFSSRDLAPRLVFSVSSSRERMKAHMFALSLLFLSLALIRPKWGFHAEEVKVQGPDVMVALDVSRSMLAQDISPDRLTRAKLELKQLASELRIGRIGLVLFAGTAFTQCPLTSDYSAFETFIDGVSVESIPHGSTAIGPAIRRCLESLRKTGATEPLVILISDGEDLGGDAVDAAKEAAKEAVVIHTVGVGTQAGAPIPVEDAKGNMVLVKEPDGALHLSRLNEDILRQIASETGGTCSSIASPSWSIKGIISRAESKPGGRSQSTLVTYYHERFQLPLFLSLALLMAEALVPRGRRMKLREEDS